jgi:DNA-binding MarR family transcriptional regulator
VTNREGRMTPRSTDRRDLIDAMIDDWRKEMPDLDRPESWLARRAARLVVLLQDALAAQLWSWDLTRTDYAVLNTLRSVGAPYELRPSDLKLRLLLSSGGVSNVLNRLEKMGLVEREQDTTDARSSWVRLTSAGVETAGSTMRMWSQAQADFFRAVPPDVVESASAALREVLIAIGEVAPPTAETRSRQARSAQKPPSAPEKNARPNRRRRPARSTKD